MEFKRINKDTVTCIITEDDMDEQGIKLEDLFEKKKEAMDFLHEVMKKAEEEVDYKPTGAFMPMQITVLPDHSISLTLSENASASFGEILKNLTEKAGIQIPKNILEDIGDAASEDRINRLNEYLKSLKQLTNSVKDIIGKDQPVIENSVEENKPDNKLSVNNNATPASARSKADKISTGAPQKRELTQEQKDARRLKFNEYVFEFADISTVIEFCRKAPKGLLISSSLYKNHENEHYYLDLNRQSESPKVFASLFTMAYEFGHFQASNPNVIAHMKESYDCIIAEKAVESMSSL